MFIAFVYAHPPWQELTDWATLPPLPQNPARREEALRVRSENIAMEVAEFMMKQNEEAANSKAKKQHVEVFKGVDDVERKSNLHMANLIDKVFS